MRSPSFSRAALSAATLALVLGLAACGEDDPKEAADDGAEVEGTSCTYASDGTDAGVDLPPETATASGEVGVTIETTIGEFHLTLDSDRTPCTTNSITSLVEQGFYDGTTCHRMTVSPGFEVLQCGDPTGTGGGGPGYTIPAEFDGTETYPAGTLAMARATDPDSGGSQFFICFGDTQLSPEYTVFGTVDQATVDAIATAAEAGVTPVMGPEDGTPNTEITFETATLD
ncbi:peptidylprolyl isomerase [Nocardioides pelophilus]|uniref:peptidylprolyl isomerase n=1 Tax=Nocardioides pelophilus TaxID=2172019 RepID=UPI0016049421|nr:peptidylprolyl isomerase [Nocardioides pelophilus]